MMQIDAQLAMVVLEVAKCVLHFGYFFGIRVCEEVITHYHGRASIDDNANVFKSDFAPWTDSKTAIFRHTTRHKIRYGLFSC